jgi:hypothetical protein
VAQHVLIQWEGAFGALGGDFSTLSINPAGLGLYRSSEFVVTPTLNYSKIRTTYFDTPAEDMEYNFNLQNIGLVFSLFTPAQTNEDGWRTLNLGVGINRHNNFNQRWIAEGFNPQSSLMLDFLNQANMEGSVNRLDDFSTGLAWDTELLFLQDGNFAVDLINNVQQRQETNTSGSIREFVISMGANYSDRLYIGATLGIPTVNYQEENIFREEDILGISPEFNSLTYTTRHTTTGTGYNFKIGAILRLTDMIRLGGAVHTPTFYRLTDQYRASMSSDLNFDEYTSFAQSPRGRFEYRLVTPLKATAGLGLVFGTAGLLSFDYEYTDYSNMRLRSSSYSFAQENRNIETNFTGQHGLRAGAEIRLHPVSLRGGYGFYTSPFAEGVNDASYSVISAGIGLRDRNFFIDFGYSLILSQDEFFLYDPAITSAVERDFETSRFVMTIGFRF